MRHTDSSQILNNEFSRRQAKNKSYSLRAFSRDIGVSAAFLSQVLSRKRSLSVTKATSVYKKLNWSAKDIATRKFNYFDLDKEMFSLISKWYHLTLVELSEITDFKSDIPWISSRLGISKIEVVDAIERLLRLRILKNSDGMLKKTNAFIRTGDMPQKAIREFHKANIKRAAKAIDSQDFSLRDFSSVTLAIDPDRIEHAKRLISDFRNQFLEEMNSGKKKSVYHLGIQFFRADKEKE